MRITTARRISQIFFFILFLWFCIVTTVGEAWWQLRGWPVNWLLQLDPLIGLATLLTTGTLYAGLLWGLLTMAGTILLGRFFCGWICPFGALHQVVGWITNRRRRTKEKIAANRYRPAQSIKYLVLIFLLAAAGGDLMARLLSLPATAPLAVVAVIVTLLLMGTAVHITKRMAGIRWVQGVVTLTVAWILISLLTGGSRLLAGSLQIGLLDPICLFTRAVNLTLLPLIDGHHITLTPASRFTPGALAIGLLFWAAVWLNLHTPRFYCRYICPLGALFGILGKHALWRMGQQDQGCTACGACERHCEGACTPTATMRSAECVLCMNCLDGCQHQVMGYHLFPSAMGEISRPDLSRRQVTAMLASGLVLAPVARLSGMGATNWNPGLIRPPGALPEPDFLQRCIKCGQCMRICPTNVIQPAALQAGIEGLWTPLLNFRMGTSGCQHGCIACGQLCPTVAIRPLSVEERLGRPPFSDQGPIRIGTAFVDRGRCLPWAMDRPCIVCQENCPVSPKSIFTRIEFRPVRLEGDLTLRAMDGNRVLFDGPVLPAQRYASGDYFIAVENRPDLPPFRIAAIGPQGLTLASSSWPATVESGAPLALLVKLQLPFVDPARCIGCGICEHECPVKGRRAIRVTAENESRHPDHRLIVQ